MSTSAAQQIQEPADLVLKRARTDRKIEAETMAEPQEEKIVLLSETENMALGMLGGATETTVQMPILTAKFCFQEGRPLPKGLGMYRGLGVQVGSMAPVTAIQVVCNGFYAKWLGAATRKLSDVETIGCSVAAGVTSSVVYGPADFLMIHQQKVGKNLVSTYRHVAKLHGPLIPWRGLISTGTREGVYAGGYLGFAPVLTEKIRESGMITSSLGSSIVGSCIVGVIAGFASHPIDTGKTVFQADVTGDKYRGTTHAIMTLTKEQGIQSLWRGGLMRTIRICGAFTIVNTLREFFVNQKQRSPQSFMGVI